MCALTTFLILTASGAVAWGIRRKLTARSNGTDTLGIAPIPTLLFRFYSITFSPLWAWRTRRG